MKKLLFTALLAISAAVSAFANDTKTTNNAAVQNFESTFRKAVEVSWTVNKNYTKATFVLNNERMEALYKADGELIGTTKGIVIQDLPVRAKRNFAKKYDGYIVKEAVRFEGNDEGAYYISAENEKESVILQIDDNDVLSVMKSEKK